MRHPFQCTAVVSGSPQGPDILLAACGPKLLALDLASGKLIGEWPSTSNSHGHVQENDGEERAIKRQKTESSSGVGPTIIKLSVAPDAQHAIAITDDKMLRVFRIKIDGTLDELSQRCMPKRPCAIDMLPNSSTILCGDKFGDVYSLPLHPKDLGTEVRPPEVNEARQPIDNNFRPTATNLTVHTQRNLRALEAQKSQKSFTARKEPLAFEHQFLLGHVSMLTDMKYANQMIGTKRRGYIITADRDEHIRVSRGPPQSYVIEGFCLGHEEFVSKVCLIPSTEVLVSGGGDDWLGVWDWVQFKLLNKISLRPLLERSNCFDASGPPIAVSGMWAGQTSEKVVAVSIERLPALFVIPISSLYGAANEHSSGSVRASIVPLDGSPIDVIWKNDRMIVSQDVRDEAHQRLIVVWFDKLADTDDALGARRGGDEDDTVRALDTLNSVDFEFALSDKSLDDLLYSVNNLRKRRDPGAEDIDIPDE